LFCLTDWRQRNTEERNRSEDETGPRMLSGPTEYRFDQYLHWFDCVFFWVLFHFLLRVIFGLLFFVGFCLVMRSRGLNRTCAWWKMPAALMKVFRRRLNFPEFF